MSNKQIRDLAQQIHALTADPQIKSWAQSIYDAAPDPVQPPAPPSPGKLSLYEHDNCTGKSLITTVAIPNFATIPFNDKASSAIVEGGAWETWTDANYSGQKVVLMPGVHPKLSAFGINDKLSSARPLEPPVIVPPVLGVRKYVTSFGGSPDPVCAYVNLRFLPCWGTTDTSMKVDEIKRTVAAGVAEVSMNVDQEMWNTKVKPVRYRGSTAAMKSLRALCNAFKAAEVLQYVKVWWMIDEPGRDSQISEADFRQCALDMRAVSAEYPELAGVKYAVIYGDEGDPKLAIDLMDFIGMNNYGEGAGILPAFDALEAQLLPHQSSMLVPGMYASEGKPMVIEQFLPHMQGNAKCNMLCVFLYDQLQQGYGFNGTGPRVMAVADQIKAMNT